ncbi:MAG: Fe-S cluster assembly protein SufD [Gammaproteobacteria bacterium]|nr:MAG: Fe-S cluster assembly protein SufD [Gammaproteobacteria bacterium]
MNKKTTPQPIDNTHFFPATAAMAKNYDNQANNTWLSNYRRSHIAKLEQAIFPHSRVEHFKYNRLHALGNKDFSRCLPTNTTWQDIRSNLRLIDGLDEQKQTQTRQQTQHAERVAMVDGRFSSELSRLKRCRVTTFADADTAQQKKIIAMLQSQGVEHNPFIVLNEALSDNGVLVEIDENSSGGVLEVLEIMTPATVNQTVARQLLIDVADNSKTTVIARVITWEQQQTDTALSTQRSIINIGRNAHFTHYHLQLENPHSVHFGSVTYNLQSHAQLKAFHAATGSSLKKIDITVNHVGQYASASLNGLYVATDDQQVDYHTSVNHPLPNGTTDENFRGIINGAAEGVFNGRIYIAQDAQKTLAQLSNKNLLLSDDAVIHTKPELEIYADDVVCSHGATVSRMDDRSLNYMLARGISKGEAELMLSFAFFNEILQELEHESVANYIRPILFKRFE